MHNLWETYAESSNSSHISIESDKQPVSVHVDEAYSIWKDRPYSETASENFRTTSTNFQIMKSKLTEGISKAIQEMNHSRKEKIAKCYADTGILDAWSPKKHGWYEEAVEKRHSLCPNTIDDSESGSSNDTDDQQEMSDLSVRTEQLVD